MRIRLVVYLLLFLFIAGSCQEPAATSAFASLEHDFEQTATDMQQQVKDEVENNFVVSPKFGRENMRPDHERAQVVQRCGDSIATYIDHLKDTLSVTVTKKRESNGPVKEQMLTTGIAARLHSNLVNGLSRMIAATLDKRDEDSVRKEIAAKCSYTFNDSGDWTSRHFQGSYYMAQTELSRMKADVRTAEKIILSYHIRNSNRGCALPLAQDFGIAIPKTTYAFPGDDVHVAVLYAAMPDTTMCQVKAMEMEGQQLKIVNGVGTYRVTASGKGIKSVYGSVTVQKANGEIIKRPVRAEYFVDRPLSVLQTSLSKIFYTGVNNHFTASVPFVFSRGLTVTASRGTLTGSNTEYDLRVTETGPLTIYLRYRNEAGKLVVFDSSVFMVKPQPAE